MESVGDALGGVISRKAYETLRGGQTIVLAQAEDERQAA